MEEPGTSPRSPEQPDAVLSSLHFPTLPLPPSPWERVSLQGPTPMPQPDARSCHNDPSAPACPSPSGLGTAPQQLCSAPKAPDSLGSVAPPVPRACEHRGARCGEPSPHPFSPHPLQGRAAPGSSPARTGSARRPRRCVTAGTTVLMAVTSSTAPARSPRPSVSALCPVHVTHQPRGWGNRASVAGLSRAVHPCTWTCPPLTVPLHHQSPVS